jgi:hypothetical protein
MKSLAALLAAVSVASAAAPTQSRPPVDLRQTLQQYHPGSVAAPRQLSPDERAQLRRQLTEATPPPAPRRR